MGGPCVRICGDKGEQENTGGTRGNVEEQTDMESLC